MRIRNRTKSKRRRAVDAVGTYLKFKAISKAAKGTTKAVKGWAAYRTTKAAAKKAPTPVKALPVVAGVGVAGAVAARKRRRSDGTQGAADATTDERQPTATAA
jgi:hypothetical protein